MSKERLINGVLAMNADDRQQVRLYYTALWLWNRLDAERWKHAEAALSYAGRKQSSIEVDHVVSCDLWKTKLAHKVAEKAEATSLEMGEDLQAKVNEIGNCMLLQKNFNISKSNRSLRAFLEGTHEHKKKAWTVDQWGAALSLAAPQVDSESTPIEELSALITERTQKVREELQQFIRGVKVRVDLADAGSAVP